MQKEEIDFKKIIRDVPDFPKKGIIFKDITTLLARGDIFHKAIDRIADHFKNKDINKVVCIESRGFLIGAPIAYKIGAGIVPIRKKGKLPYKTISKTYQLEYGVDSLEMHEDAINKGENILIVDDLLATGGTVGATIDLVKNMGGKIAGIAFLIELSFLEGRKKLKDYDLYTLIKY